MKYFLFFLLSTVSFSNSSNLPSVNASGFADIYYVVDYNNPSSKKRQDFFYNHNRHDALNLNLLLLQMSIEDTSYRSNIGILTGTYSSDNYANEKGFAQHIYEASIGVPLDNDHTLWADAGVFSSFIGFESAVSMDNLTLTRSLAAENSPYFFTGAKVTYTPNDKWLFLGAIVNGWQRIDTVEGNSLPSFGTQIQYTSNNNLILNWSTFVGTDDPDVSRRMRYFNNLYAILSIDDTWKFIGGFDLGFEQKEKGSTHYYHWYTPVAIAQYRYSPTIAGSLRAEYYEDKNGVIISTPASEEFKTFGTSLNFDYTPRPNMAARIEGRWLKNSTPIFEDEGTYRSEDFFIGMSFAIKFNRLLGAK